MSWEEILSVAENGYIRNSTYPVRSQSMSRRGMHVATRWDQTDSVLGELNPITAVGEVAARVNLHEVKVVCLAMIEHPLEELSNSFCSFLL